MTKSRSFALVGFLAVAGCEAKKESGYEIVSREKIPGAARVELTSSCGDEIVRDEGLGKLRIGALVDSVVASCPVIRDTTFIGAEGMPARILTVMLSRDTVDAEIVDNRIWRIAIGSPVFRTADSLGVGTPLSRLLQLKNPRGMTGEGKFFVASPEHCGMSFRLANAGPGAQRGDLDQAGLARLPKSTVVSQVLIFGCHLSPN